MPKEKNKKYTKTWEKVLTKLTQKEEKKKENLHFLIGSLTFLPKPANEGKETEKWEWCTNIKSMPHPPSCEGGGRPQTKNNNKKCVSQPWAVYK